MSIEHMQLSEPESSQESDQLQSSAAESEIEEDVIMEKYKKVKYVHQASGYKPHSSIYATQKRVRDEVYWITTELSGHGFCYRKMQIAIQVVGKTMFGTRWKLPRELDKDHYNIDSNEMEDESMSQNLMQIHLQHVKI